MRTHELIEVLVAGDDHGLEALLRRLPGERADHVVGFIALEFDDGVVEALHDLPDPPEAVPQVVRHLLPGRLVLGVDLITERVTGIEDDREVVRLELLPDIEQEPREAERRGGVLSRRIRERPADEREVRAIDQRVRVDQEDAGTGLRRDLHRGGSSRF